MEQEEKKKNEMQQLNNLFAPMNSNSLFSNVSLVSGDSNNVRDLINIAQDHLDKLDIDQAEQAYEKAFKINCQDQQLLLSFGAFLRQKGDYQNAEKIFKAAILENPESQNYKIYFEAATDYSGQQAVEIYERGIQIIETHYNWQISDEVKRDLSTAHAALAEIYQTDLLDFKESEPFCVNNIQRALQIDPECLDAHLQVVNYHLNQEEPEKSVESMNVILKSLQKEGPQNSHTDSFKLQVVKLCTELEIYSDPIFIIEKLLEQDENNFDAHYMLAFCHFQLNNLYAALQYSDELLAQKGIKQDQEIFTATIELKEELNKLDFSKAADHEEFINKNGQNEGGLEEGEGGQGDDQWMDLQ